MKQLRLVMQDIQQAGSQYNIWLQLGLLEVKQRYRRSVLGPWWITLSTLIFIVAMGMVFSRLLAQSLAEYVPFFTTGFLLWSFISTSINDSTDIFRSNSGFIKQLKLPYNMYILKFLSKNIIFLAHNFVVYLLVIWFFKFNPGWKSVVAIPGLLLLILNMYWMCLFTALISTRFRDMVPIVNSGLQILFFITPISWMPRLLGSQSMVVQLNPFSYLIDIVRQPLLGADVSLSAWVVATTTAVVGLGVTLGIFRIARPKIPFWID
jgi:ABC-type polysaccharide/polyol phosphate export permease